MQRLINVKKNLHDEVPATEFDYCYFRTDYDGNVSRDIDLTDSYPYVAFPVTSEEFRQCQSSMNWNHPVTITDGRYAREAEVIRTTQQGVVSFRYLSEARPVGS